MTPDQWQTVRRSLESSKLRDLFRAWSWPNHLARPISEEVREIQGHSGVVDDADERVRAYWTVLGWMKSAMYFHVRAVFPPSVEAATPEDLVDAYIDISAGAPFASPDEQYAQALTRLRFKIGELRRARLKERSMLVDYVDHNHTNWEFFFDDVTTLRFEDADGRYASFYIAERTDSEVEPDILPRRFLRSSVLAAGQQYIRYREELEADGNSFISRGSELRITAGLRFCTARAEHGALRRDGRLGRALWSLVGHPSIAPAIDGETSDVPEELQRRRMISFLEWGLGLQHPVWVMISESEAEIQDTSIKLAETMRNSLSAALTMLVNALHTDDDALAIVCYASAVEALVCDKRDGISEQLARNCSALLESDRHSRPESIRRIKRLYGDRSKVVHGERTDTTPNVVGRWHTLACEVIRACWEWSDFCNRMGIKDITRKQWMDALHEAEVTASAVPGVTYLSSRGNEHERDA